MRFELLNKKICQFLSAHGHKLFILCLALVTGFSDLANADQAAIHSDSRLNRVGGYLLKVSQNEEMGPRQGEYISQKEQQETIRFINRDQVTFMELFNLRESLRKNERFTALNKEQQTDIEKFFRDVMDVEQIMNDHRTFDHMWCRFALRDNPMDEVPANSIFKNLDKYRKLLPGPLVENLLKDEDDRAVIGFCWLNKENDSFNKTGTIAVVPNH